MDRGDGADTGERVTGEGMKRSRSGGRGEGGGWGEKKEDLLRLQGRAA